MIKRQQVLFFILPLLISLFFAVFCSWAKDLTKEEIRAQNKQIEALYREATALYFTFYVPVQEESDVLKAKEIFEQILKIDPTQEKAKVYLDEKIPARLELLRRIREEEKEKAAEQKVLEEEKGRRKEELEAKRKIREEKLRQKQEERMRREEAERQERLQRRTESEAEAKARREEYLDKRERNEGIKDLYKEAFSLYYQDKLDEAKKIFEKILKMDPEQNQARIFIEKRIPSRQNKKEGL